MQRKFRLGAGLLGLAALALQYGLVLAGEMGPDLVHRSINFFSYFTILTNVLVVLAFLTPILVPATAMAKFFRGPVYGQRLPFTS